MNVCLSKFTMINSGEALSLDIIRMERVIATNNDMKAFDTCNLFYCQFMSSSANPFIEIRSIS